MTVYSLFLSLSTFVVFGLQFVHTKLGEQKIVSSHRLRCLVQIQQMASWGQGMVIEAIRPTLIEICVSH